ncbi:hypothetical protein FT663_04007 [Candidozyma haemuli var. vulneris]|uniref:Uncharacterized protein n=1 Tax=Candidozyma haemuli TaxID=45357 RepID=A0A2V1AW65_9ASCO|nr:hypothetical protein CXQ85_000544 [[Candida] haemuloni]KAF3985000.1 hypothetical protein FT662_05421 [[Candida] haemuloni var. vulneris]KAF3988538.1 hypothetical protein FT663_04007 [[Candida] haemuloni var. vulneris]PVH21563.1 hypothetical protein CXQ85_000544 [[Candida] haemuloni]
MAISNNQHSSHRKHVGRRHERVPATSHREATPNSFPRFSGKALERASKRERRGVHHRRYCRTKDLVNSWVRSQVEQNYASVPLGEKFLEPEHTYLNEYSQNSPENQPRQPPQSISTLFQPRPQNIPLNRLTHFNLRIFSLSETDPQPGSVESGFVSQPEEPTEIVRPSTDICLERLTISAPTSPNASEIVGHHSADEEINASFRYEPVLRPEDPEVVLANRISSLKL